MPASCRSLHYLTWGELFPYLGPSTNYPVSHCWRISKSGYRRAGKGKRTREAGRDTGSNKKWLIRRSWSGVPWRVPDNCFSCASPSASCEGETESRPSRGPLSDISSLTDANRTAGEPPATRFASAPDALVVLWSGPVYHHVSLGLRTESRPAELGRDVLSAGLKTYR
jgi:hypothetical protein